MKVQWNISVMGISDKDMNTLFQSLSLVQHLSDRSHKE